tara:strand:+ start:1801 stop:2052 length:252 start_codon:yes stop_codon:yes gene_type:complete
LLAADRSFDRLAFRLGEGRSLGPSPPDDLSAMVPISSAEIAEFLASSMVAMETVRLLLARNSVRATALPATIAPATAVDDITL